MADWTDLPNLAVGVGGLPSGTTVTALRDNPIAIIKSAPGAPRPLTATEFRLAQPFSVLAGEVLVGPFVHSGAFNNQSTFGNTYSATNNVTILSNVSGAMRFRAAYTASTDAQAQFRLMKNDTEVFIFTGSTGASGSEFTDQTVAAGDVFRWELRRQGGSGTVTLTPEQPRGNDKIEARSLFTYGSDA